MLRLQLAGHADAGEPAAVQHGDAVAQPFVIGGNL
jgi:hypothetical protein